jgi:hypothetical protein
MSKYRLSHSSIYIEASIECIQYADSSKLSRIVFEGLEK